MSAIFISFVHEDELVAAAVKALIEAELKLPEKVFLSGDKTLVYAGDRWLDKITLALKEAKLVVLMLSKRSVRRPWVNFEAGGAWLTDKTIIPCCYGNQRKDSLPHPYASIHALDLKGEAHFMLQSIHHQLGLTTAKPESPFDKAIQEYARKKKREEEGTKPSLAEALSEEISNRYKGLQRALEEFKDEE